MPLIRPLTPADEDAALTLIVAQQSDPTRACPYVGTDRDGILAELDALEVPWRDNALVAEQDGRLIGVTVTDYDDELGRSWIHGPWVDGDWLATARPLLEAAIEATPDEVTQHEISSDPAHLEMAELAAERGWRRSVVNLIYVLAEADAEDWPAPDQRVRLPEPSDQAAVEPLHDREFPNTYAPMGRLLADAADGTAIVRVIEDEGTVRGYAAGQVQGDGSGYLDFIAVDPEARGRGLGAGLLIAIGRAIIDASGKRDVNLTVQEHRSGAIALYERLGYRREGALVGYSSPPAQPEPAAQS